MRKSLIKIRRGFKNKLHDDCETLVREATSTSSTFPTGEVLRAINSRAQAGEEDYSKIFAMIWKRLTDAEYPRHVIKALLLLDYMIRGSDTDSISPARVTRQFYFFL